MFKKKPQIKNLSPLRSSDRRRLADQIITDYKVEVPTTTETPSEDPSVPTLASVRSSLLPENCLSARFTTTHGPASTPISGTVYVGAHPGQEERILWFQYGKETTIYPTAYTLWQNPGLVPLLHTPDVVVAKLQSGADLMTPGLFGGPPWPEKAKQGAVVAVAGLEKDSIPVWVGVCKIDISAMGKVQGMKGVAVEGLHWLGDEIYNWSQNNAGGRPTPEYVKGWLGLDFELNADPDELIDDDETNLEDGGVSLSAAPRNDTAAGSQENKADTGEAEDYKPSTAEVDAAFHEAFIYAVYKAKNSGNPKPRYGIDFPVKQSYLLTQMLQPNLRYISPQYSIKHTSWKNLKKFVKQLSKEVLVKTKDQGGETIILDIDFDDQRVQNFTPYQLSKPKAQTNGNLAVPANGTSSTQKQSFQLVTVYRSSPKLYPDLLPEKSSYYTASQIGAYLKTYIASDPALSRDTSSPRFVKVNPFIANTFDVPSGEISRDALNRAPFDTANLLTPYYILLTDPKAIAAWDPANPSEIVSSFKPRPYPAPAVLITLEKRAGNKTVTRVSGLEVFNINPQLLGPELQKKCAGSATVGQLVGGKPGMLEITVQGDQRDVVKAEMAKRGIKSEWIKIDDKVNKKKNKS
jgi:translation initiation factor 2D